MGYREIRKLDFGDYVWDVGLVERRERKALLAEMVQGSSDMNQRRAVNYQETVVELVGHLDRERVAVLRVGLVSLLSREKDMTVVGEAETGEEAVSLARELKPDIVVMDLMMPLLPGAEATRQITSGTDEEASDEQVRPRVLVFTSYGTSADLARAVLNGASGVLLKNAPTRDLP